jgi:hypothetical protein
MVQLIEAVKNFDERAITSNPKCANLGTVPKVFPASHETGFLSQAPK